MRHEHTARKVPFALIGSGAIVRDASGARWLTPRVKREAGEVETSRPALPPQR